MLDDLFDILHCRYQMVLHALSPEPPVTGPFEMMVLRRLAKAAFNQCHAPAPVLPGFLAAGLRPALEERFIPVWPDDQSCVGWVRGFRASDTPRAAGTVLRIRTIIPARFVFIVASLCQAFASGTLKGVCLAVVYELGNMKNLMFLSHAFGSKRLHVRGDPK